MELFKAHIIQVQEFLDQKRRENQVTESVHPGQCHWPLVENKPLVMGQDTAVELGNPKTASTSQLLWTNTQDLIQNRRISIVGPDLSEMEGSQAPFGKIVLVAGEGFDEQNSYARYRALEKVRYTLNLSGYMMRGASQFQREWSRVSHGALKDGFSLKTLGSALMDRYLELDFVRSVEIVFITSSNADVLEMNQVSANAMIIIGAMNKMTGEMAREMALDCDACEYVSVCSEVAALRSMRRRREQQEENTHA